MPEYLRSVSVRIEVDTNKRTDVLDERFDSRAEALAAVQAFLADEDES